MTKWTHEDTLDLITMIDECGMSMREAGENLGRSKSSCIGRYNRFKKDPLIGTRPRKVTPHHERNLRSSNYWEAHEDGVIIDGVERGLSGTVIAKKLPHRTAQGVYARINRLLEQGVIKEEDVYRARNTRGWVYKHMLILIQMREGEGKTFAEIGRELGTDRQSACAAYNRYKQRGVMLVFNSTRKIMKKPKTVDDHESVIMKAARDVRALKTVKDPDAYMASRMKVVL